MNTASSIMVATLRATNMQYILLMFTYVPYRSRTHTISKHCSRVLCFHVYRCVQLLQERCIRTPNACPDIQSCDDIGHDALLIYVAMRCTQGFMPMRLCRYTLIKSHIQVLFDSFVYGYVLLSLHYPE